METTKALITVSGIHGNGDMPNPENVQVASVGRFGKKGKAFKIEYDESELTGMAGTRTTIIANQTTVAMKRTGTVESYLTFSRGRKQTSYYNTQYGSFEVGVEPYEMEIDLTEQGGFIHVGYEVEMNHMSSGVNSLDIQVKPIYD